MTRLPCAIAIVGLAVRLPGAPSLGALDQLLRSRRHGIGVIGRDRFDTGLFYHGRKGEAGRSYSFAAGVLEDVRGFDAPFFGISPREAAQIDPQQRLALELAWEAMEDAGLRACDLRGSDAAVFVGASSMDYLLTQLGDPWGTGPQTMLGTALSIIANRVSFALDLRGESLTLDTACSSSMMAIHQAAQAVASGRAPLAIAGGVNMLLAPYPFIGFSRAGMLSPSGRCHSFGSAADGYVRSEGGGMLVLKPLEAALSDGDRIRAIILATGANTDGRTSGLSLPSAEVQAALLARVYGDSGIDPDRLGYLEAHGTGTQAGDPVEAEAIANGLGRHRSKPLPIGSVKSNLGHLEPASGVAGIAKAILALASRSVAATLCGQPNPQIPWTRHRLEVACEPVPLADDALIGVSSFGFGGANAHVVLGPLPGAPMKSTPTAPRDHAETLPPLLVAARSARGLDAALLAWRHTLETPQAAELAPLLRAAARRRDQHPHRAVLTGGTTGELVRGLEQLRSGRSTPEAQSAIALPQAPRIAFVFSGNGAQWPGMGQAALAGDPILHKAVAEVDAFFLPDAGWSILAKLERGADPEELASTEIAQPLLFALQVAIVRGLAWHGIHPSIVLGHSVGEIAAAWASGALSLADATRLVRARSQAQARTHGSGRMAALGQGPADAAAALAGIEPPLSIAAINAPGQVTIAGPSEAIAAASALAEARGWLFRDLGLDYAFHSPAMDPIQDLVLQGFAGVSPASSRGPRFISTVTGERCDPTVLDAAYWWRNLREPVRFADAIGAAAQDGATLFVEIGPQPVLQSYVRETLREARHPAPVTFSFARRSTEAALREAAARLHAHGADLTSSPLFDGEIELDPLPAVQWARDPSWFAHTSEAERLIDPPADHPLLGWRVGPRIGVWRTTLDPMLLPWLADHRVGGSIVFPAAGFAELALAAARNDASGNRPVAIRDLELRRPLVLPEDRGRVVETRLTEEGRGIEIRSRALLSDEAWTLHATARVDEPQGLVEPPGFDGAFGESQAAIDPDEVDRAARVRGLDYGPCFRPLGAVQPRGDGRVRAALSLPDAWLGGPGRDERWILPPPLLDGAFQALLALLGQGGADATLLPVRIRRLEVCVQQAPVAVARARLVRAGERGAEADLVLQDATSRIVAWAEGCAFAQLPGGRSDTPPRLWRMTERRLLSPAEGDSSLACLGQVLATLDSPPPLLERLGEAALLAEGFVSSVALDGIAEILPSPDCTFATAELVRDGRLSPASLGLLERLLGRLSVQGLAQQTAGSWRLTPDQGLPQKTEIWRAVAAEAPELGPELTALAHAAETLPIRLRDGQAARNSDVAQFGPLLGQPVEEETLRSARACLELWPTDRPVRCLVLGAGSARLCRGILQASSELGLELDLTLLDPDRAEIEAAATRIGRAPRRRFVSLDPAEAELPASLGRFDLILAPGIGAMRSLVGAGAARMAGALAEGGVLIAVQPAASGLSALVLNEATDPRFTLDAKALAGALHSAGLGAIRVVDAQDGFGATRISAVRTAVEPRSVRPEPRFSLLPTETPAAKALAMLLRQSNRQAVATEPGQPSSDLVHLAFGAQAAAAGAGHLLGAFRKARETNSRLWVVTQGAGTDPAQAALWGLVRVARNETGLDLRLLDLDASLAGEASAAILLGELAEPDAETEILRGARGERRATRLSHATASMTASPDGETAGLSIDSPGLLETLRWRNRALSAPGTGEVLIEVEAAGLNFRDVMWAQGLLPEELLAGGFAGPGLGMECAGTIREVGQGAGSWQVGDRVMAFAPRALARRVVTRAEACMRIPRKIGFEAAATIPVAFLTAHYTLSRLARIEAGETLLVHGGAGGVGLAALQVAKARGARVIATAGSPAKRAFLRAYGADFVSDSRSLAFAREVREWTAGAGVDVVLNSLAGEALEASLGLLRPFGRFIELGKRDFALNSRIGLRPLARNIAFFGVDADALLARGEGLAGELFGEVAALFEDENCVPLPFRRFDPVETRDAFRLMQASGHVGKIIVTPPRHAVSQPAMPRLRGDCVYVVSGGTSGLGLAIAGWLARAGVRRLALISRRGVPSESDQPALARMSALGVEVACHACDVGDQGALAATLARIRAAQGPIGGVVHAAAVLEDGILAQADEASLARVFGPKLEGAWNLHRLTEGDPIETFLLLSSATTAIGNPGQGAYVAANLGVEAIARVRRAEGRPGVAVALGPVADAGMLARAPDVRRLLEQRLGLKAMSVPAVLAALPMVLASRDPVVILADLEGAAARARLPILSSPTYEILPAPEATADDSDPDSLRDRIVSATPGEAADLLAAMLAVEVGRILGLGADGVDRHRPLSEIGMDSLMAVELGLVVEQRLGTNLSGLSIAGGASVASLSETLARTLQGGQGQGEAATDASASSFESRAAGAATVVLPGRRARERSA